MHVYTLLQTFVFECDRLRYDTYDCLHQDNTVAPSIGPPWRTSGLHLLHNLLRIILSPMLGIILTMFRATVTN